MGTTALSVLRQKVAKKLYAARYPIVSVTTSDSDSLTVLKDVVLSPAAQIEDFIETWIFIAEQATAVDSEADINEGGQFSATDTTLTVDDGTKFTAGDGIQFSATSTPSGEICRITSINSNDLTIVRGIQETTATTHENNDNVFIIGPAIGEIARVTDVAFDGSNSQLTIAPGFTASLVSGTDYEIHYKFYPVHMRDKINEILENVRKPVILPLTLITDGDMEASDTDDWTAAGTGGTPTLAKNTSTVLHGRRSLSITNDSSTTVGYAKSTSVYVPPSTICFVAADVYVTPGDKARLTFYDVTNSVAIDTATTVASGWVHLEFTIATPTSCEEVQIWLESQAASDVTYWGSVQLLPTDRVIYDFPSTLEWSEDLNNVFYFPKGAGLSATGESNSYAMFAGPKKIWSTVDAIRDETAVTPFRLQLKKGNISQALYIGGSVDYATLSSDTDTTNAPEDIIVNLTYADMMDAWAQEDLAADRFEAANAKMKKADNVRRLLGPRMRHFWKPHGRVHGTRGR